MIERKILIGLITSTDYIRRIYRIWNIQLIQSPTAREMAKWCIEYFDTYKKAPMRDIETIYYNVLQNGKINKKLAEEIESEILPSLSEEYELEHFNVDYLLKNTYKYFNQRLIEMHQQEVQDLNDRGMTEEAEQLITDFKPLIPENNTDIDFSDPSILDEVEIAFAQKNNPLLTYPGPMGKFMNNELVRGGFVAFLAPEKRGKTWQMLDMALRGVKQGCKVGMFQAGDMTKAQILRRIGIYLTHNSDQERYIGDQVLPVRDCIRNQLDTCTKTSRESNFGCFDDKDMEPDEFRKWIDMPELLEAFKQDQNNYRPCHNCSEYWDNPWGTVWLRKIHIKQPLEAPKAKRAVQQFFLKNKRYFKISTHANGTLSINRIKSILEDWERRDNFVPDILIIDYADLLVSDSKTEFRHQQNQIWKDLRGLNQQLHCLLITATQADGNSYKQNRLNLTNYSEDKRKYGHVTAMFGLNQDTKGREKRLGLLYINEILLRESDYDTTRGVYVMQHLKTGRPFMGSFF